jgi:autotransporter-associated beta strand protein
MKKTTTRLFWTGVAFMMLVATTAAWAASGVWNGTVDALWINSANWSTSPYPSGSETASINNAGNGQTTIDLAGLTSISSIIFDSPAVAAYTVGSGAANSQTLIMADGGVITLTDTAANSPVVNAGLQLGTTMAAGTYTITNAHTSQTLTFNRVFGATSGGNAAAKTLVVTGPGNTSILGDLWRGGASSLTLTHNSSGTLTLAGSNTVAILNMNGGSNSVVDIGSGFLALSNGGGNVLNCPQGGTINGNGKLWLSTQDGLGGYNYADLNVAAGKTLVINPEITGPGGFETWTGSGTFVLNGINTFAAHIYLAVAGSAISVAKIGNSGSVDSNLGKGTNINFNASGTKLIYTGSGEESNRRLLLNNNATLDHSGTGTLKFTSPLIANATAKTLTLQGSTSGIGEIADMIPAGSGTTTALAKNGTGTWILSSTNTYAGTTVVNGGTLILSGPNGAINASTAYTLNTGGTLLLDNTSTANNTNRLRDASTITMNGGTLSLANNGGAVNYRENAGTLAVASGGNSTIATTEASVGQSNTLTFSSLTYSGGKINFTGTGLGVSDRNRIFIGGVTNGLMGAWATVNGASYAAYSSSLGVYAAAPETTFTDIAAEGGVVEAIIPDNGALWARINLPGLSGPITLQGEWTNSIGQVLQNTTTNTTIATFDGVTNKLLRAAGLSIAEGKNELKVGVNENDGLLSALTAGGTLVLENNSAGNALTVNAAIVNNTSASALSKIGAGTVVLNGTNTYTGTTYISEGILAIAGASPQAVSGTTTIGNGTLAFAGSATKTVTAAISGAGNVVKTGTSTLNLNAANTFAGGLTINEGSVATAITGGLGAGGVTNNSTLNLTYAGAITYTGLSTSLAGSGTNNVTLGTGSATAALNGDYSAFTGVWNVGVGAVGGAGKVQMNGLDNSAATINILSNATIFCSVAGTHNAKIVLNGGNTGEVYGQLRIDNVLWAGPITLAGPITDGNDAFFGNDSASTISGVIDDLGNGFTVDKLRGGTLTFSGANTYSGPTWVRAGAISVPAMGSISGGASPLGSQTSAFNGRVKLGTGGTTTTLIYTGTGETTDRMIDLAGTTGGANLTHSGTGLLKITGGMMISGTGNKTLTLQGSTLGTGEFSGIISNGASSVISVTKAGTGMWTLSGVNTYTGPTTVSGGTLLVNGSTGPNSAVTVNNGCTLGGSGTINGTVAMIGGSMMAPGDANSIGTLTLGNGSANALSLNGNGLRYDLSTVVDVCDKIAITGASGGLVLNGVNVIALTFPNGAAPAGDYTLMTFPSYTGGGSFVLAKSYPNAALVLNANSLVLHVEGGSTYDNSLTWKGNISGIWDNNIVNWTNGSASVAYTPGDAVTFDDTAAGNFTVSSVSPVAPAAVLFDNSVNAYTVSADIVGAGTLVKVGSSTATLSGVSTYNPGLVTIAAGTLTLGGASLLNSGDYATNIINSGTFNYDSSATQTLSGAISGAGALVKSGSGALILSGTNTFTGNLTVNTGNLLLAGSNALATAVVNLGAVAGDAVVKMPSGSSLVGSGDMTVGSANNGNGALYLDGGNIARTGSAAEKNFAFGTVTGGYGYFKMTDGNLFSPRFALGINLGVATSIARITGGASRFTEYLLISRSNGGIGVMTIDGGAVYHTNATANLSFTHDGGRGELNMTGGLLDNTGKPLTVRNSAGSGATGIVNICSGTLTVDAFVNNSTALLNFNGGLLKASASSAAFLPATMTGVYVNGSFGANAGGANIDSDGRDITFAAPLSAPTGKGVTAISLSTQGSGYIGEPYVSIAGDGVGATAVANMVDDGTGKGTYKVASVTVTAPGVNYTTATVSFLKGGTTAVAPTVGAVTLATATPAGLAKLGTGVLTLGGVNTYGGETTISGGTLRLGVANALPTNSIVNVGSNMYDLGGFAVTNGQVNVTSGAVINGGLVNSALTVTDTALIKAGLSGSSGLTKNGPGTLILKGYAGSFTTGPLVVNGGTLTLSLLSAPPATGLSYWLDASDGSKITLAGSNVTDWADSSPAGVNFIQGTTANQPVYVTNAINGLPAVRFNGTSQKMVASKTANAQTVFIVNNVKARANIDGIWGWNANDIGIRLTAASTWAPGNNGDFANGGQTYINGLPGAAFTYSMPHLVTAVSATQRTGWITSIGQYYQTSRWYNGDIGEVLVYSSILSTNDRERVEGYLMNKWFGVASSGLPSVTLATGTILDLDGQSLTVTNLVGSGTVSNGTLTVTGTLSPANTNVIGTLTAKANITLSGTFVADVDANNSDLLDVQGNLTLSSPTLEIKNQESLNKFKIYTLATCSGTLAGTFASTNLTDPRWTLRYTTDGKVQFYFKGGTILLLR